jgi:hypothetical protein
MRNGIGWDWRPSISMEWKSRRDPPKCDSATLSFINRDYHTDPTEGKPNNNRVDYGLACRNGIGRGRRSSIFMDAKVRKRDVHRPQPRLRTGLGEGKQYEKEWESCFRVQIFWDCPTFGMRVSLSQKHKIDSRARVSDWKLWFDSIRRLCKFWIWHDSRRDS